MAEKLPELLKVSADAVSGIDVDRMVVMDGGDGRGLSNVAGQRIHAAIEMIESVAGAYGLDVDTLFRAIAARAGGDVTRAEVAHTVAREVVEGRGSPGT